jgi:hypothetical protein
VGKLDGKQNMQLCDVTSEEVFLCTEMERREGGVSGKVVRENSLRKDTGTQRKGGGKYSGHR